MTQFLQQHNLIKNAHFISFIHLQKFNEIQNQINEKIFIQEPTFIIISKDLTII